MSPYLGPRLGRSALALGLGAVGGAAFHAAELPLAWMLGAMCASTAAAVAGLPLEVPPALRALMIAVLGIMLGGVFTPDVLAGAGRWLEGLGLLVVYLVGASLAVLVYFRRLARYDRVTAYFSATPGGLNEMVLTGEAMGGDSRVIGLTHAVRVLAVVLVVPFYLRLSAGEMPPGALAAGAAGVPGAGVFGADDAVILGLCGLVGFALAARLKIRAAQLVGPMLLSAAAHLSGLTDAQPPGLLVALAQVVVGTAVGCRFAGVSLARVRRTLVLALGSAVLMLGLAAAYSDAAAPLAGAAPAALFLAFAPGGLAEMSLVALALGVDTAFVSTMHVFRIILVVIFAPLAFRLMGPGTPRS